MLNYLRRLLMALAISVSCISATASPPDYPLLLNSSNGPEISPADQWTVEDGWFTVAIPDLSVFKHPTLWYYGFSDVNYSPDNRNSIGLNNYGLEQCSLIGRDRNCGTLSLLPKCKGFLKFKPTTTGNANYYAMIIDLPEAEIDKLGEQSRENLEYELLAGERNPDYIGGFTLVWDEQSQQYIGKVRCDLSDKNGNFINIYHKSSVQLDITIADVDGSIHKAPYVISNSDYMVYVPQGSRAMEINFMCNKLNSTCDPIIQLLSLASSSVSSYLEYTAVTPLPGGELSREYFYDFTGDGIFSVITDGTNNPPVLTSLFPDGNVYCLDNKGHRLLRYNGNDYDAIFDDKESNTSNSMVPFDYNLDGKYDFKYGDNVYTLDNAGNLNLDALKLLSPEQYEGLRSELKLSTGGEGIPGMGDMFISDSGLASDGVSSFADFNADGLSDVMVTSSSANTLYLNTCKDRTLIYTSAPKAELIRDFDGDGLVDIVIKETDGLKIYLQRRGQPSQVVNAFRGFSGTVLGARDVDNDGDIDLIVSSHGTANPGEDYYVAVIENLGNGKFKKHENFLLNTDRKCEFHDIVDVDADGKYEIIFDSYSNGNKTYSVRIETVSKLGEIKEISDRTRGRDTALPLPVNNDGRMSYPVRQVKNFLFWATDPSWGVNSRPSRPIAPTLTFDPLARRLCVSWPIGSDAETPAADLTYELRIGTSEGAADIVAANALPDGTRRIIADGSNGYAREKIFDVSSWPTGKIYVSYQVVDACWRGSEFSPAAVFENDRPAVGIVMTADLPGVGKPFEAWLENGPAGGSTYTWTCSDDGTVEVIDSNRQRAAFTFATPGKKLITLSATDTEGRTATVSRKVDVNPQPIKVYSDYNNTLNAMDLDGDGILELNNNNGFYIQKPDGTFEKYRRMFNSKYYSGIIFDYNRDGLPDILGSDVLLNLGDGDMEILNGANTLECRYDINNDGFADSGNGINNGTYKHEEEISGIEYDRRFFYDYDGDGLLDIISPVWDSQNRINHIMYHRNIEGLTFANGQELLASKDEIGYIADIDGDGIADIICNNYRSIYGVTYYGEYITVNWGNGSTPTKIQCPDGRPFSRISAVVDLDNNGVLDLIVELQSKETTANLNCAAVYIYADHSYVIHDERKDATSLPYINAAGNWRAHYNEFLLSAPNKIPEPPTGLRAVQSQKNVEIEWNPGSDEETPISALRYNISVKHKGAEGENAYLISPMNGDNDRAPLPMPMRLLTSTKFTIPIASIPAGEYEIKLQTVDTRMGASRFSEPLLFKVEESACIELPTTVIVGIGHLVRVSSNYSSNINFGEDSHAEVKNSGSMFTDYTVTWSSEGLKEVKADGKLIARTMAVKATDASFNIPEKVLAGVSVNIPGGAEGKWDISTDNGKTWNPVGSVSDPSARVVGNDYAVVFAKTGNYLLQRTVTRNNICGKYQKMVTVVNEGNPEISLVSCDNNSHYQLNWNVANIPAEVTGIKVYRETEIYGVFTFINEVMPSAGTFTDESSNADVCPSRYRISWILPYGESEPSAEHQPIHVQINKGLGEAINLMWSHYQGTQVQSYRILSGTSPDKLEILATINGNISSYTDLHPDGVKFYAVETVTATPSARSVRTDIGSCRSNVVCSTDARDVIPAQRIAIISPSGTNTIYMSKPNNMLTAAIMPAAASSGRVNWEIVAGADKASIDAYGRLTCYAPGIISVKATTCDGSGVSVTQDFEILYSDVLAQAIDFVGGNICHIKVGEQIRIEYTVLPIGAYQVVEWSAPYDDPTNPVLSVTPDGLITGLREGNELVTAHCIDGSGWFDSVNIFVEPTGGVNNVSDDPSRIRVYSADGLLTVTGVRPGEIIRVFTTDGSQIVYTEAHGYEMTFPLNSGFYIICAGGQSFRIKI